MIPVLIEIEVLRNCKEGAYYVRIEDDDEMYFDKESTLFEYLKDRIRKIRGVDEILNCDN